MDCASESPVIREKQLFLNNAERINKLSQNQKKDWRLGPVISFLLPGCNTVSHFLEKLNFFFFLLVCFVLISLLLKLERKYSIELTSCPHLPTIPKLELSTFLPKRYRLHEQWQCGFLCRVMFLILCFQGPSRVFCSSISVTGQTQQGCFQCSRDPQNSSCPRCGVI